MRAMLLASGIGSRLRPITNTIPKCLVSIHGQPLLDIWLQELSRYKIGPFLINTHYLPEKVERYVQQSAYKDAVTLVHEPQLLGTAGTVWANREWIGSEPFMLVHADNYCLCDFGSFVESHQKKPPGILVTMMTFETSTPQTCGILEISDDGVIQSMHEKVENPPGNTANAAVYIVEPAVFEIPKFKRNPPSDFSTEVIPELMGTIKAWQNSGIHEDIGTPESYRKAHDLKDGNESTAKCGG